MGIQEVEAQDGMPRRPLNESSVPMPVRVSMYPGSRQTPGSRSVPADPSLASYSGARSNVDSQVRPSAQVRQYPQCPMGGFFLGEILL